jgi:hypothetical protein
MFGMNACALEATLARSLDDAILIVARLEDDCDLCPTEAHQKLAAAQTAWIAHKMTCGFCFRPPFRGTDSPYELVV